MQKQLDENKLSNKTSRWWRFFLDPIKQAEQQSLEHLQQNQNSNFDIKTAVVLITVAVSLTIQRFIFGHGAPDWFQSLVAKYLGSMTTETELAAHLYFVLGTYLNYLLLPGLVIKLLFHDSFSEYGLKRKGAFRGSWIYLSMMAVMLPLVVLFSTTAEFQQAYPFYSPPGRVSLWPTFWIWEMFYITQFFALECFFRGFIVHGTKHRFGFYSIFVMMVPYCMIHFSKPMPECFGAIGAGIVLGFLSLKTCSIWGGFALHLGVALTMDFLSLYHHGRLVF